MCKEMIALQILYMFNSRGDNFKVKHFQTLLARFGWFNLSFSHGFIGA